jgi:hypothetical protein
MKTSNLAAAPLLALASFASAAQADQASLVSYVPDCRHVVFQPEDPPVSKTLALASQEWDDSCIPEGGHGDDCWQRPGPTDHMNVRLSIKDRKPLLPWESDVFQVCLTGPLLRTETVSAAYDYGVVRDGATDGDVVLAPGAKKLLPPDPRGVQAVMTPQLTLQFHDQWARYYPGGTVVLKIQLIKEVRFWPDETIAEKEITLAVSDNYVVELGGAAAAPGGVYYARYTVRRLGGAVSTETETPALETQKVSYEPGSGNPGI